MGPFAGLEKRSRHRFHHRDKVTLRLSFFHTILASECVRTGKQNRYHYFCFNYLFLLTLPHNNYRYGHYIIAVVIVDDDERLEL